MQKIVMAYDINNPATTKTGQTQQFKKQISNFISYFNDSLLI